jgi:glycosyltransferase involved in cell wall biosynthesis
MRVAHVITRGDVGGAQTHVVELATAQREADHAVLIVAGVAGPATRLAAERGIDIVVLPTLVPSRLRLPRSGSLRSLIAVLERFRPDVVHGHSSHAGLLARLAASRAGMASVYTAHGWPFQQGANPSQRVLSFVGESIAGRLGSAVICLTEAEAIRARRWRIARDDHIWIIPNGLRDVPEGMRRRPSAHGPVGLVMVARFAPPKQQRQVIDALAVLAATRNGDWSMTFVGDGPEFSAIAREGVARLGTRVTFLGSRDDVPQLLASFDVHVLWSRYEGMPISMLEAMRAGLCCVATDLPGTRALAGTSQSAVLLDPDAAELSRSLADLVADRAEINRLGAAARARYEASFSISAMAMATEQVYETVRADAPRSHRGGAFHNVRSASARDNKD